jgi:hypothetical protein
VIERLSRRHGPRRLKNGDPQRVLSISVWPDTLAELEAFAAREGLYKSGAAHQLLRQALGLGPLPTETNPEN